MGRQLSRRDFLGLLGGGIATMMLPDSAGWANTGKKPNFILIFADDFKYILLSINEIFFQTS